MLRGHATLQEIIGKSGKRGWSARGSSNESKPKRFQSDPLPSLDVKPPSQKKPEVESGKFEESGQMPAQCILTERSPEAGIPDGFVKCPVCHKLLEDSPSWTHLHIDNCLAKKLLSRRTQPRLDFKRSASAPPATDASATPSPASTSAATADGAVQCCAGGTPSGTEKENAVPTRSLRLRQSSRFSLRDAPQAVTEAEPSLQHQSPGLEAREPRSLEPPAHCQRVLDCHKSSADGHGSGGQYAAELSLSPHGASICRTSFGSSMPAEQPGDHLGRPYKGAPVSGDPMCQLPHDVGRALGNRGFEGEMSGIGVADSTCLASDMSGMADDSAMASFGNGVFRMPTGNSSSKGKASPGSKAMAEATTGEQRRKAGSTARRRPTEDHVEDSRYGHGGQCRGEEEAHGSVAGRQLGGDSRRLRKNIIEEGMVVIRTVALGRKHHPPAVVVKGARATLRHEADNAKDENALLVVSVATEEVFGYLPAAVAACLAVGIAQGNLTASVLVLETPARRFSSVQIELQVAFKESLILDEDSQEVLRDQMLAAVAAAEEHTQEGLAIGADRLRANFQLLALAVLELDHHLLDPQELSQIELFLGLPEPAQRLHLRLLTRQRAWWRISTLKYAGIGSIKDSIATLVDAGFAVCSVQDAWHAEAGALLAVLLKDEAAALAAKLGLLSKTKANAALRRQLQDALCQAVWQDEQAMKEAMRATGPCVRLEEGFRSTVRRVQRLFFLNEGHDLSRFTVTDMGVLKYPSYTVHRTRPVFPDREALLEYEAALQHAAQLDAALEAGDNEATEAALAPALEAIREGRHKEKALALQYGQCCLDSSSSGSVPFVLRYSAAWVFTAMATLAVSWLEKQRRYKDAVDLLHQLLGGVCCPGRRGEWWLRLSLDVGSHLGKPEESLEMAEAALADEWVRRGDRLSLQRRVLRLARPPRRWKRPPWAASLPSDPKQVVIQSQPLEVRMGARSVFLTPDGLPCSVEELALHYYATPEAGAWTGVHSENGVWSTLFGLLMWEVLFMPVPDVFRNPFQTAPLDLNTPMFAPARRSAIEARLAQIEQGQAPELLRACWVANHATLCVGVSWDRFGLEDLVTILECVGPSGMAAVCRLLAEDHAGWSGGMPDLLLWRVEDRRAKLSEVKGPRDQLSDQQRAWLAALSEAGIEVEVLKVKEPKKN
eukprot:jgi/Botrbrau1/7465/Bobra.0095s0003.2